MSFTIGSLFDGSGGFPLAATMCGGTPKWASEVEPYPIAVTKSRFPNVKHLGSVTDIKGGEVEPVDVITFGSPCQDLSVAGKRAGLKHEANGDDETTRSGLFMEAVRIIKEMREATNGVYPRFALWENVPGAFSSNKGEDFRIVLEELIKIAEPSAVMPEVPKAGWPYADSYCGDGWSLAYRVLDAQFWGVPQRRRRIYLVADFRGECAGKVSFEREGLRGYFETSRTPWQATPGDAESGSGAADCERKCWGIDHAITTGGNCTAQGPCVYEDIEATLKAAGPHAVCYGVVSKGNGEAWPIEEKHMALACGGGQAGQGYPCAMVPYTLKIRSGCEGGGKGALIQTDKSATLSTLNDQYLFQPICFEPRAASRLGGYCYEDKCGTLRATMGDNQFAVAYAIDQQGGKGGANYAENVMPTLCSDSHGTPHAVCYPNMVLDDQGGSQISVREDGKCPTLRAEMHGNVPCVMDAVGVDVYNQSLTGDKAKTLNSAASDADHVPCAVYSIENHPADSRVNIDDSGKVQTLTSRMGTGGVACTDVGWLNSEENQSPTLLARMYKDPHLVSYLENATQYIVRRLTPTECARLQGFPDTWGHPIEKTEFTDEEYQFWLNVRNTHAAINDKATKEYTKDQILKWYNGLHTDSSEYKMWGNGIALPNALYMMQGIAEVMSEEKVARRKWLDALLGDCL